jgi:uncharacterized protein (TIGR02996 family)
MGAARDEELALRAAILAAPDDDAPRLRYADWLDELGDDASLARAELIRVQCALARISSDSDEEDETDRRWELQVRESDLLDDWQRKWETGYARRLGVRRSWLGRLVGGPWPRIDTWYERGMIVEAAAIPENLRAALAVLEHDPVRTFAVHDGLFHAPRMIAEQGLNRFRPTLLYPVMRINLLWRGEMRGAGIRLVEFRVPCRLVDWLWLTAGDDRSLGNVRDNLEALPSWSELSEAERRDRARTYLDRLTQAASESRGPRVQPYGKRKYQRPGLERRFLEVWFGDGLWRAGVWAVGLDYLEHSSYEFSTDRLFRRLYEPRAGHYRRVYGLFRPDRIDEAAYRELRGSPFFHDGPEGEDE